MIRGRLSPRACATIGGGERLVHRDVPALPGAQRGGVDDRALRQVPHLVLEEPQQRVGDDVVGLLVDACARPRRIAGAAARRRRAPRAQSRGSAAARRSPSLIAAATQVTGTWRPTWPSAVTRPPEPRRGRSEPSAAGRERHRPAVRGDDQAAIAEQLRRGGAELRIGQRLGIGGAHRPRRGWRRRPRAGGGSAPGKIPSAITPATETARATEPNGEVSMGRRLRLGIAHVHVDDRRAGSRTRRARR